MTYGEAWRLTEIVLSDPSSQLAAAVAGWSYPLSREDITMRDLYDLQHITKAKRKPKPYPRPWPDRVTKIHKPSPDLTQDQIIAALRFAGHTAASPG